MPPTLILVFALYGIACALYLGFLVAPREGVARLARLVLLGGFLAHTADIGLRCIQGIHPVQTTPEALSFCAWLLTGGYLATTWFYPVAVAGGLVAPVALVLMVLARATPGAANAPNAVGPPSGLGALGRIHITLSTAGLALFALAAALAVIYLIVESQLKSKKVGRLVHRGPPLATLDSLGHRLITVGFPVFTIAIVTGAIWVARLPHLTGSALRPEYSISMVTWLAFAALLVARTTAGWQGRRAAWLTLAGFAGALVVVLLYVLRYAGKV